MADRNEQDPNGYMAETMPANNPKPEVTQADLAAVARLPFAFTTDQMQLDLIKAFSEHRIAAERATRERVLEEAARAIENRWRFSKASAAVIRAMKEEPK